MTATGNVACGTPLTKAGNVACGTPVTKAGNIACGTPLTTALETNVPSDRSGQFAGGMLQLNKSRPPGMVIMLIMLIICRGKNPGNLIYSRKNARIITGIKVLICKLKLKVLLTSKDLKQPDNNFIPNRQ